MYYLALFWTITFILTNFELTSCPSTAFHSLLYTNSYEILIFNYLIMLWSMVMYEKMFGVKQSAKYLSVFSAFIVTTQYILTELVPSITNFTSTSSKLSSLEPNYSSCINNTSIHVFMLCLFHCFLSSKMKKAYLFGFFLPIWVVPAIAYGMSLVVLWNFTHFELAVCSMIFQNLFRKVSKRLRVSGGGPVLPLRRFESEDRQKLLKMHQNVEQNFDFETNKLNISEKDVSEYRLKQLLGMGYPREKSILALSATGSGANGKPVSSAEAVQKAVELLTNQQVVADTNVTVKSIPTASYPRQPGNL